MGLAPASLGLLGVAEWRRGAASLWGGLLGAECKRGKWAGRPSLPADAVRSEGSRYGCPETLPSHHSLTFASCAVVDAGISAWRAQLTLFSLPPTRHREIEGCIRDSVGTMNALDLLRQA